MRKSALLFWLILFVVLLTPTTVEASVFDLPLQGLKKNKTQAVSLQLEVPMISFGQLLLNQQVSTGEKKSFVTASQIEEFLKQIEQTGKASWEEFEQNRAKNNWIVPTPFIPPGQLVAGISDFVITPVPTLHPNLEKILADTAFQGSNSINNSSADNSSQSRQSLGASTAGNNIKASYLVALLGDSMTDTLGFDFSYLNALLKGAYPNASFSYLNYGQGATDLESGLARLTATTRYLDIDYPPLLSFKPDILVVESFAYNHWSGQLSDLNRQWLTIAKIIDTVKLQSPQTKIILASTIGPDPETYGDGVLNWPINLKWDGAIVTKAYLQNLINFAVSQNYPLADAYTASLGNDGHGIAKYINQTDHLHPSDEGKKLYLQKIYEAIIKRHLIN